MTSSYRSRHVRRLIADAAGAEAATARCRQRRRRHAREPAAPRRQGVVRRAAVAAHVGRLQRSLAAARASRHAVSGAGRISSARQSPVTVVAGRAPRQQRDPIARPLVAAGRLAA